MKRYIIIAVAVIAPLFASAQKSSIYTQTPHNSKGVYEVMEEFTCEFDKMPKSRDWQVIDNEAFATWTFKDRNVEVKDGMLNLVMKYDDHTRPDGRHMNFSSGMLRSTNGVNYGYFEARIKGAHIFPGTCTAFWLYNRDMKARLQTTQPGETVYSEIDIIEIQQVPRDNKIQSFNLHVMTHEKDQNGKSRTSFKTAGKYPKMGKNEVRFDWDSRDDYHLYACESRPDSIIFYVDNQRVAARANYHWHLDMLLTLSLGLRTPYEKYEGGTRAGRAVVQTTEQQAKEAGFPTAMKVDYVRSWKRKDYSKFNSSERLFNEEDYK